VHKLVVLQGLEKQLAEKKLGHVGIGGAFRIVQGKIKGHIIRDFKVACFLSQPVLNDVLLVGIS